MDLSKLKVVDLRAQLQERGLDTKGVKATLIERLQAALEVEEGGAGESDGSSSDVVEVYPSEEVEEELEPPEPEPVIETRRRTLIRHASPPPTLPEPDSPELPQVIEDSSESESPKPELLDSEPEDEPKVEEPVVMKTQFIEEQSVKSESEPEAEDDEDDSPPFETTLQQSKEVEEEEDSESVDSDQMQPAASVIPPLEVKAEEPLDIPQDSEEGDEQSTEESTAILQVKSEIDEDTDMVEAESSEKQDDEAPAKMEATDSSELADKMEATDSSEVPEKTETTDSSEVPEKDSKAPEESSPAIESSGETKEPKRRDNDHKPYESKKRRRSNSQSRSKSPRRLPTPAPNIDDFTNEEDEPEIDPDTVSLSWYDSDLHLRIESTDQFCTARPITTNVLALAWAGARTTHGVRTGKVAYEVQLTEELRSMFVDQKSLHEFRCGWSKQSVDLQLGESALSYGYGSNGKKSNNNTFSDYGCKYGVGDVIGVYLDLESEPCRIEYTVNGKSQGDAFEFDKSELGENEALFPHVMTKSIAFRVNFGQLERCLVNEYKKVKKTKPEAAPVAAVPVAVIKTEEVKEVKEDAVEAPADVAVKKDLDEDVEMPEVPEVKKENASDDAEKVVAESEESEETKVEIKSEVVEKEEEKIEEELIKEEVKEKVDEIKMEVSEPIEESKENATKDEVESEEEEIDDGVEKVLLPGYMFIKDVPAEELVKGYVRPDSRKECEVILMVGLPGAGKTHWAKQYAADNKQKYFNILGTHVLFEKMKIDGESRKAHHVGRFEKLNEYSIKSLSALQDIANKRRRNYILDQTNVYASAQRRKMKGFGDFKRIAVVVIPDDDEFKRRMELKVKAENKDAPDPALNEMKANFSLPSIEFGWFDELQYTDLETEVAKAKVEEYNEKGRKALPVQISGYKRFRRDDGYGRDRDRRGRRDDRDRDRDRRPSRWGPNADTNRRGGGGGAGGGGRDRWSGAPPPPMPLMQNWRGGGGGGGGYDQRRDRWGGGGGGSMHGHRGGGGGGGRFEPRGGFRGGPQGPPPMHHYNNGPPRPYGGGGGGGDRRDRRGGGGGGDDRRGPRNDRDFRGGGSDRDRDSRDRRDKGKMDVKKGPGGSSHKGYSSNGSGHSSQSQYGQGGWSSGGGGGGAGGWSGGGGSGWSQQPPQQQQQNWGNWQGSGGASNWKGYASSSSGGQYGGGGGGGATGASAAPASTTAAQQQQWASYWSQQQGGGQAGAQHQQSGGSNQWSNWQQYQPAYSTGYAQQPPSAASKSGVAEKK